MVFETYAMSEMCVSVIIMNSVAQGVFDVIINWFSMYSVPVLHLHVDCDDPADGMIPELVPVLAR